MGLIKKLFGSRRVTARELKLALRAAERDRDRRQAGLRKLEGRREELFAAIKRARARADNLEVDRLWEDLRVAKAEAGLERKETRILQLEVVALKRAARAFERMEERKDQRGVQTLLRRIRESGLDEKLMAQEIRDEDYLRELDDILRETEAGLDSAALHEEDPEKQAFLAEIDAINSAEETGDVDGAREREAVLKRRLEAEEGEA